MIKPGLVSITFRKLTVEEIIRISLKAGIEGIEWGGDIHVPHGDIQRAEIVGRQTREAGLEVAAYGSYYNFDDNNFTFEEIINTTVALGAPLIRVWAGKQGSVQCSPKYYSNIVRKAKNAGDLCSKAGIKLAFEFHGNTVNDSSYAALRFMRDIQHKSVYTYWQPTIGKPLDGCLKDIDQIKNYLQWIHVFHWEPDFANRRSLSQGEKIWREYFRKIDAIGGERWALLEFVKDDSTEVFYEDAQTLINLLNS